MSDRCQGVTRETTPCQHPATHGSYCWQHQVVHPDYANHADHPSLLALSGPSQLTWYRNILGRRILLLGEYHLEEGLCTEDTQRKRSERGIGETRGTVMNVVDWIDHLVTTHPGTCLDVLVESPYVMSTQHGEQLRKDYRETYSLICPIYRMVDKFPHSHQRHKIQPCQFRYHFIDIREMDTQHLSVMSVWKHWWGNWIEEEGGDDLRQIYYPHRQGLYQYLLGLNSSYKSMYNQLIDHMYQIALTHPEMKTRSTQELQQAYDHNRGFIDQYQKLIKKTIQKLDPQINQLLLRKILLSVYMDDTGDVFQTIHQIPMDLYCLLRIFMVYDETKMSRGPVPCRSSHSRINRNMIVLTGQAHTEIYKAWIDRYFQVTPEIHVVKDVSDPEFQCLRFQQPFDFFE